VPGHAPDREHSHRSSNVAGASTTAALR
jgi:hypothetical protein